MAIVLFACVRNAGRSQMASAFFNVLADPAHARALSAGTHPADRVSPIVIAAMKEIGIDISANRPQRLTEDVTRTATLLVTMGCGDECPYVPGVERDDWPLADPEASPPPVVRAIRDEIQARIAALVISRGWAMQEKR